MIKIAGSGKSAAGRLRLSSRLTASLLYLKHAYNLRDEDVVARWAETVAWQNFSGQTYYEPKLPCNATQVGRFRTAIGEAGGEQLLKATTDMAVKSKGVRLAEFERIIVDCTVQEKAISHPVDSRLLEFPPRQGGASRQFRRNRAQANLCQGTPGTAPKCRRLSPRQAVQAATAYCQTATHDPGHRVLREINRKLTIATSVSPTTIIRLKTLLERAERIRTQQPKDKSKLYSRHAPEVECIGKGKASKPYEFGVKASIAVTHKSGLIVGARTFPGNPNYGHVLYQQRKQTTILLEDTGREPKQVVVDFGYRGVDKDNPGVEIIHRGKYKSLTKQQRRWLKRRQAIDPAIGHLKTDNRMDQCWLFGQLGDALHTVLCAAGYSLRWLVRALVHPGVTALLLRPVFLALLTAILQANPLRRIQALGFSFDFASGGV
jgi:IS5 family transposase